MTNLTELVQKYHNSLTKKEIDYLTKFNFTTSNFYGLPKVRTLDKIARTLYENGVQPTSRWSDIQEDRPIL